MSNTVGPLSQQIARERARRQALKERSRQQESIPMSQQIAMEIERRRLERGRCKALLVLVWSAPALERETREGLKNAEEK